MQRRKFIQFFGATMVGTSLAIFGAGSVSKPILEQIIPGFKPENNNHILYQDSWTETKWIGGEDDTFSNWAPVWAKMAGKIEGRF